MWRVQSKTETDEMPVIAILTEQSHQISMTRVSHDHYISMNSLCSLKASQLKQKTVWERLCGTVGTKTLSRPETLHINEKLQQNQKYDQYLI